MLRGQPINFGLLSSEKARAAVIIALHCMLNGPVGVRKVTSFPIVGEGSIISLVANCSNKGWKESVRALAQHIKAQPAWLPIIMDSQQYAIHNDIWPLWEPVGRS